MASVLCVGIATLDLMFAVPELPKSPGKHRATERIAVGGGVAANAAVTVARLGGRASFAGRVGDDAEGILILAELEREAVDVGRVERIAGCASPVSFALVADDGERLIVNHTGAELFAGGSVEVDGADAVLADMRWQDGGLAALQHAAAAGVPGILDCDHDPTGREATLSAASHVVFAMPTLATYVGSGEPGEALRRVEKTTNAWVAATAGADGVFWREGDELAHLPAFEVPVVDTLGAGDVFHGAFALALAEGADMGAALRFGSAAAAIKCSRFGGRSGIPIRAEVDALLGTA